MRISVPIILLLVFTGCKTSETLKSDREAKQPKISVKAGINKGGITENTDMTVVENATVDAFTGATERGFHLEVDYAYPVGKNYIEAGVNYMYNKQAFTYAFDHENFFGIRNVNTSQLMLPLTFNAGLFRKKQPDGLLQFHVGYVLQYNMIGIDDAVQSLPSYGIQKWSNGATVGIALYPVFFENGNRLGWYVSGYRGSQIYEDIFNLKDFEIPGSSYVKTGIVYQFKTR